MMQARIRELEETLKVILARKGKILCNRIMTIITLFLLLSDEDKSLTPWILRM